MNEIVTVVIILYVILPLLALYAWQSEQPDQEPTQGITETDVMDMESPLLNLSDIMQCSYPAECGSWPILMIKSKKLKSWHAWMSWRHAILRPLKTSMRKRMHDIGEEALRAITAPSVANHGLCV
jgi:hypothetical protein